jgi:pimeloyl-ACP methyl ester carboxylesterase
MLIIVGIIAALFCIFLGLLMVWSPGQPSPFVDANNRPIAGNISEKIFVNINGVEQGMFIKSNDVTHPVLLYLHGGMPDYFLTAKYPTGLENYFTIVWWEQRGSGLSYHADMAPESVTLQQLIADTQAITNYLRHRFGQDRIYLMGHSGGTFIGIQAAAQTPDLYHAYIGVAQMSYQLESEVRAYEYMLQQFKENGNTEMVQKLLKIKISLTNGISQEYLSVRDQAMHSLGIGTTRDMRSVVSGIFFPSLLFHEYTLREKFNLWRGKSLSGVSILFDTMITTDLSQEVTQINLPIYFFHGIYDYTCSYPLAKSYFEKIQAPIKGFYTFEHSAHSPIFEEPEKVQKIIIEDILKRTNRIADYKK